jgi:vancomycin resistance protein YoaR
VQISPLGYDYARRKGVSPEYLVPVSPIARRAEVSISIPSVAQHNVGLAAQRIDGLEVAPGAEVSFLGALGEVSAAAGYREGQAIVDGMVGSSVGGGICYVSTALYRAAFLAGLEIVERRPHSLALASFSDAPGFDAAVDTRGPTSAGATTRPTRSSS